MFRNLPLFIACAIASFVPWALVVKPLGEQAQIIALGVQLIGLAVLIIKRKQIWYLP